MTTFFLGILAGLFAVSSAVRFDYTGNLNGPDKCALITVAMDESFGMETAQEFMSEQVLPEMARSLYHDHDYDKVYLCSGGFGSSQQASSHNFVWHGCTRMKGNGNYNGNRGPVNWASLGYQSDGWAGMLWSMGNVTDSIMGDDLLDTCDSLNKNLILVTNRDKNSASLSGVTKAEVQSKIAENGYILNAILDINIMNNDMNFGMKISTGALGNTVYTYDATSPGYQVSTDNVPDAYTTLITGDGNTIADYADLLLDKPGMVWNINSLGQTQSRDDTFADIFVLIKVAEIPGTVAEIGGDPHITTWKNEHYEYHGQCDLVMMADPDFANGLGLKIHIRTKLVRFWSYIETVAIRIGNDVLEIQGSADADDAEPRYWYNYEYQGEIGMVAGLFPVTQVVPSVYKRQYKIDLSTTYPGQHIIVQLYKEFVRVRFHGDESVFGNTVGLLGDYKTGKTFARDGITDINDYTDLGNEWQVLPTDGKLFRQAVPPQFPELCIQPEDPRGERQRRLSESNISIEQAEETCASLKDPLVIKDCVYDILATQDLDMVGAF